MRAASSRSGAVGVVAQGGLAQTIDGHSCRLPILLTAKIIGWLLWSNTERSTPNIQLSLIIHLIVNIIPVIGELAL